MDVSIRIVHVSDMHLEPAENEQYPGLAERVERIADVIRSLHPDLVVATGDLTNRGSSRAEDLDLAKRWLDGLRAPYLAVPGNHDLGANRKRGELFPEAERYEESPYAQTGYARAFGQNVITRAAIGDLTVFGIALREEDPDGALDQLARALTASKGPVVVAGHYPVVAARDWPSAEAFGSQGYVDEAAPRLVNLIRGNPQVIAYLCGHVHLTSLRPIGERCQQFTAGGVGPGAAALRLYEWDGRDWSYATLDVEGPQTFWEDFSESARRDPHFSTGASAERDGTWSPPAH